MAGPLRGPAQAPRDAGYRIDPQRRGRDRLRAGRRAGRAGDAEHVEVTPELDPHAAAVGARRGLALPQRRRGRGERSSSASIWPGSRTRPSTSPPRSLGHAISRCTSAGSRSATRPSDGELGSADGADGDRADAQVLAAQPAAGRGGPRELRLRRSPPTTTSSFPTSSSISSSASRRASGSISPSPRERSTRTSTIRSSSSSAGWSRAGRCSSRSARWSASGARSMTSSSPSTRATRWAGGSRTSGPACFASAADRRGSSTPCRWTTASASRSRTTNGRTRTRIASDTWRSNPHIPTEECFRVLEIVGVDR